MILAQQTLVQIAPATALWRVSIGGVCSSLDNRVIYTRNRLSPPGEGSNPEPVILAARE
jgi:hypothetical protein